MATRGAQYLQALPQRGLSRVNLIVPTEALPLIKAYAQILRASSDAGLPFPKFQLATPQSAAAPIEQEAKPVPTPAPKRSTAIDDVRALTNTADQRRVNDAATRPDFSGGLLGKK